MNPAGVVGGGRRRAGAGESPLLVLGSSHYYSAPSSSGGGDPLSSTGPQQQRGGFRRNGGGSGGNSSSKQFHFTPLQALGLAAVCSILSAVIANLSSSPGSSYSSTTSLLDFDGNRQQQQQRRAFLLDGGASSGAGNRIGASKKKKKERKKRAVREIERIREGSTPGGGDSDSDSDDDGEPFSVKTLARKSVREVVRDRRGGNADVDAVDDDDDSYEDGDEEASPEDDDDEYEYSDRIGDSALYKGLDATTEASENGGSGSGSNIRNNNKKNRGGGTLVDEDVSSESEDPEDDIDDDDDDGSTEGDYNDDEDVEGEEPHVEYAHSAKAPIRARTNDDDEFVPDDEEDEGGNGNFKNGQRRYGTAFDLDGIAVDVDFPDVDGNALDPDIRITRASTGDGNQQSTNVAWLMSFPNSGTSFTIHMAREASNATTATNYALEGDVPDLPSVQAIPGPPGKYGPFLELIRNRHTAVPETILTKTHCIGYCSHCGPRKLLFETPRSFLRGCLTGTRGVVNTTAAASANSGKNATTKGNLYAVDVMYSPAHVTKAIHLYRHPLDNIVARFHLEYNEMSAAGDMEFVRHFPKNATGFRRWCRRSDEREDLFTTKYVDADLKSALRKIPCFNEFFKYVQWHNMAGYVLHDLGVPFIVLHYHEYSDDFKSARKKVLKFLGLPIVAAEEYEFHPGKVYRHYYNRIEKVAIRSFIKEYATPDTWDELRRYDFEIDGSDPKATE